jgi:glycosyltransferase involved in cell wall biosynthesis
MRFYQYIPVLKEQGIDVDIAPLLDDEYLNRQYSGLETNWAGIFRSYLYQMFRLLMAKKYDLLWIEKELFPNMPAWVERFFNFIGIRMIIDYDDATFHRYEGRTGLARVLLSDKIDNVMKYSVMTVCGNSYLAERARIAGATRVEILPTVIDINRYSVADSSNSDNIVIGWIGSPSTVHYLDIVAPAILSLASDYRIQLRIIGANYEIAGLEVDCRPWSEESEVGDIQEFDIGIMPLHDSKWEQGKCGYKLIQCMACAKPVIASPVGVNVDIIENGVNGYLASSTDDWIHAFRSLIQDTSKRKKMGIQGRRSVENQYTLQISGKKLANLFYNIIESRVDT